jgi:hypothetical protein
MTQQLHSTFARQPALLGGIFRAEQLAAIRLHLPLLNRPHFPGG